MHDDPKFAAKLGLVVAIALAAAVITLLAPAIPQDPSYHRFADQRTLLGIRNFWNVASNLAFLPVGLAGIFIVARRHPSGAIAALRVAYLVFFSGVALIALGSGYYHLEPANASLAWDRLPMTVSFTAFFAIMIGENIAVRAGRLMLWPLIALGLWSVVYWYLSELEGRGDLRGYILVQFLPMLLIPLILLLFRSPFVSNSWVWLTLFAYAASKLAELGDVSIFEALGVGGHTLKHLFAAAGALAFVLALLRRRVRA